MQISKVTEPELGELLPLMRSYCDFYGASTPDTALLGISRSLIADPERAGAQFLARADDGTAVGFATLFWCWETTLGGRIGVMNDLFVSSPWRGLGAAEALIAACREHCRRGGARRLRWQTAPENLRAQAVYDRVGGSRETWVDYWLDTR